MDELEHELLGTYEFEGVLGDVRQAELDFLRVHFLPNYDVFCLGFRVVLKGLDVVFNYYFEKLFPDKFNYGFSFRLSTHKTYPKLFASRRS